MLESLHSYLYEWFIRVKCVWWDVVCVGKLMLKIASELKLRNSSIFLFLGLWLKN